MALMQYMWRLRASLRSATSFKGEFVRGGQINFLLNKESSSPLVTRGPESDSVTAAVDLLPSHRSFGYSFKYISRMFATSAIQCLWLRGGRCRSVELLTEFRVSKLEKLSDPGLYSLMSQNLGSFFSRRVKANAPNVNIYGLQQVWNDHWLSDKQIQMITDGVIDVEACKCTPRVLTSRRSHTRSLKGVDGLCEADEDSEVEGYPFGGNIHVEGTIENVTKQDFLHAERVLSLSNPHSFYHVSILEDSYESYAGKESSHLEFSEHCEGRYHEDRSMNLDNEGVHHVNLRLLSGACCLPHPNKVKSGGEDAYFISSEEQVLGVADGVGGWADVGVDAGDYARELMLQSKLGVAQEPHGHIDPARVLIRAHARTKCRGSSTACILALSDCVLQAANLGDSGFVMMRNGRIIFKSPVQQHQFNIPFQLENGGSDPPTSAEVFSLEVASGDVLVAGTDGLFDNLYDNEILGIVTQSTRAGLDPQLTAHNIAALARERAEDRNRQTPFSTCAREAGFRFYGGKMDDITVIVSFVTSTKQDFSKL